MNLFRKRYFSWSKKICMEGHNPFWRCYDENMRVVGYVRQHHDDKHPEPLFDAVRLVSYKGNEIEERIGTFGLELAAKIALAKYLGG